MAWFDFVWTDEFLEKIALRGITEEEVRDVVESASAFSTSYSSGRPLAKGYAFTGRYLVVVFDMDDDGVTVIPVTAFTPEEQ